MPAKSLPPREDGGVYFIMNAAKLGTACPPAGRETPCATTPRHTFNYQSKEKQNT